LKIVDLRLKIFNFEFRNANFEIVTPAPCLLKSEIVNLKSKIGIVLDSGGEDGNNFYKGWVEAHVWNKKFL